MNKSQFSGVQIDKRLVEANNILNAIHELKEYASKFATLGSDINYDFSDNEVIILKEEDGKIRVDISNLSNNELDQLGTKMTIYIEFNNASINNQGTIVGSNNIINDKKESSNTTYSSYKINLLLATIRQTIQKLESDFQKISIYSYNDLKNLPSINDIVIKDNKNLEDYGYSILTKEEGEDLFNEIWEEQLNDLKARKSTS